MARAVDQYEVRLGAGVLHADLVGHGAGPVDSDGRSNRSAGNKKPGCIACKGSGCIGRVLKPVAELTLLFRVRIHT